MLDTIINKIKELDKEHLVIAIDGKAASGKTTLANLLKEKLSGDKSKEFYNAFLYLFGNHMIYLSIRQLCVVITAPQI